MNGILWYKAAACYFPYLLPGLTLLGHQYFSVQYDFLDGVSGGPFLLNHILALHDPMDSI